MDSKRSTEMRHYLFWGLTLIIVGGVFLADRLGYAKFESIWNLWPWLIAVHGGLAIAFANNIGNVIEGAFSIVLAFWLYACFEHLWGWTFIATWPIIVIAGGVAMVLRGLLERSNDPKEGAQ